MPFSLPPRMIFDFEINKGHQTTFLLKVVDQFAWRCSHDEEMLSSCLGVAIEIYIYIYVQYSLPVSATAPKYYSIR